MSYKLRYKHVVLGVVALLVGALLVWYYNNRQAQNIVDGIVSKPGDNLISQDRRVNVALLGIAGDDRSGADLTDSMMFISHNLDTGATLIMPIPRDIWVDSLAAKINTAYHYGQERREGGGRDLVKSAIAEVVGQSVHYVLILDFAGFEKAIDAVGGIEVEVERTFDDYKYPIPGAENAEPESARYSHVHFDKGTTHMDGKTALQFARSRHAEGEEGSDFARAERQKKIMIAFRNKVLSSQTLLDSAKINDLIGSISSSIDTDITGSEYGSFGKIALGMDTAKDLHSLALQEYLVNPKNTRPYGGQWVLIPRTNWQEIHDYVTSHLPR